MLLNYHIVSFVLVSLYVGDFVRLSLSSILVADLCCSLQHRYYSNPTAPNLQHTAKKKKNKTTDVVINQHSRKLLMMDILMSETC